MPAAPHSLCTPSPPTFKRPQPLAQRHRKRRPAPSPPPDLTQWRLVNSAVGVNGDAGAPEGQGGAHEGLEEAGGAAAGAGEASARRPGVHPAVGAAWDAPVLWDEHDGGVGEEAQAGVDARHDDEPLSTLSPLTRSTCTASSLHASRRRLSASAEYDENRGLGRCGGSEPDDADDDDLPPSLDELYARVLPKTRRALDRIRQSTKRRSTSISRHRDDHDDAEPDAAPPKRKKRRMPPTPPDSDATASSWEEHDLTPPDRTVPLKYPLSRHATQSLPLRHHLPYLGPDFLGADDLDALSPHARTRLLRQPFAPRLSFGSGSSPSPSVELRASRRRRGRSVGRSGLLALGADSDDMSPGGGGGGEGPPRLAAGQAAKGVFLEAVAQTGFYAGAAPGPAPREVEAQRRRGPRAPGPQPRVRLQSVQDIGARFEKRALRDAPAEGGMGGGGGAAARRSRERARTSKKPRLWLGPEDEAGDVGELDERAAHLYISTARPLPPHRKPGARPTAARPVHLRFVPVRRPPPTQLVSLRRALAEEDASGAQLDADDGGASVEMVVGSPALAAAAAARATKQRPSSFRFVVGARNKPASGARVVGDGEEGDLDLGQSDAAPPVEEPPRAGGGRSCTPELVTPAAHSSGDVFLAGHRPLRRMSTYGVSLFAPRHESDPLEDKETPPPVPATLELVVGAPATPQSEVWPGHDAHESSHSYRDGHDDTLSPPLQARAVEPTPPPRTDPLPPVTPSLSFPAPQQRDAAPHHPSSSRSPSSTSSFDRSGLAALAGTASSPLRAHYPSDLLLLPGMATGSSTSSTGLALPIPLHTPCASFQYSSPPCMSALGPTVPDEEDEDDEVLLPTEQLGELAPEKEQVPPTSALEPRSLGAAPDHPLSDAFDELDIGPGDDAEVHYTALAVAKRTRRALEPARRSTVGRAVPQQQLPPPPRKAQTTVQGVLTPPESTRKAGKERGAGEGLSGRSEERGARGRGGGGPSVA
ncbi:hypothetical protein JCM3775_006589 [Rhodotorula graminis]